MQQKGPAVNREELLRQFDGDEELLAEVVDIFLDDHEQQLRAIAQAVQSSDASTLEIAAHTLKGSIGNFGADQARAAAFVLEKMGRSGDLAGAAEGYQQLLTEVERVKAELIRIVGRAA